MSVTCDNSVSFLHARASEFIRTLILDSSEGETLFGGLFDNQACEQETSATENDTKSWKNEGKIAVAESVGRIEIFIYFRRVDWNTV